MIQTKKNNDVFHSDVNHNGDFQVQRRVQAASRRTRKLLVAGAALLAIGLIGVVTHAQCADGAHCELVWADEFDGTVLDPGKWTPQIGNGCPQLCGWGNNELQFYRAENATVADGNLTITARQQSFAGHAYTSARLRTINQGDWTYGRFEMRARLPTGNGMWPAFWMLPTDQSVYGTWAASGEIDIMETIGSAPDRIFGTLHFGNPFPENTSDSAKIQLPPGSATNDFHTYAVEWREGEIRWYLDGELYSVRNSWFSSGGPFSAPFDIDFHLLLNLAVGGNFPGDPDGSTQFPQAYVVDYVRVYQFADESPSTGDLLFDGMEHGAPFDVGYFAFDGTAGGGGIGPDTDVPPNGGRFSLGSGWGSGGTPGFYGGFGSPHAFDLSGASEFVFWINPDANQDYTLEFNLQEDDNGDGQIGSPEDDEFQFNCVISPTGPCAIAGGGWQEVRVPLSAFFDDNSFLFGGNGVFDPVIVGNGGNGGLAFIVVTVVGNSGSDVSFRTDNWLFARPQDTDGDGTPDAQDNCVALANALQRDSDGDGFGNRCDADLNNDCIVNVLDLGIFRSRFFGSDPHADFNGDGVVNVVDLGILRNGFFGQPGPSGQSTCPGAH